MWAAGCGGNAQLLGAGGALMDSIPHDLILGYSLHTCLHPSVQSQEPHIYYFKHSITENRKMGILRPLILPNNIARLFEC